MFHGAVRTVAAMLLIGSGALLVSGADPLPPMLAAPATTTAPRPAPVAADKPSPKLKAGEIDPAFAKRHEEYAALAKKGGIDLYFEGDSITDFWHSRGKDIWNKEFVPWNPANFGISGDRTQHVLWRMKNGELDGVKPKVFVLMIGTNNVGGNTNNQIVAGNAAIIKEMRDTNPQAKILLLAIFPRWTSKNNHELNPRIKIINAELAKLDDGKNIKFLDIGDKFLVDGALTADIMPDGLHPNAKGFQIWADAIRPTLTNWLGEPAAK